MITMLGSPRRCCDGLVRREALTAGALSMLGSGFTLPRLLAATAPQSVAGPVAKAKSVIVLYLLGGAGSQDMWDLKPNAPVEVRGEFKPVATNVPGMQICEHMPRMSRWMHKTALIRSVNHKAGCHNPLASYSGYDAMVGDITITRDTYPPSMGSVCQYLKPTGGEFPDYIYMPTFLGWGTAIRYPGPYAGFLGKRHDPFFTECEPFVDNPPEQQFEPQVCRGVPRIPNGVLAKGITLDRLSARKSLVAQFDDQLRANEGQPGLGSFDPFQERAMGLLTSSRVKAAFDLETEPAWRRERYTNTLFGNSALIARKLVQEGVRFVNVTWDGYWERHKISYETWDTHHKTFPIYRNYMLPYFDQTFAALLEDLQDHGLLDETLVVVLSEMGRTPKINANAGRDHWTFCYTVVMAGAGIRGGSIYGASDAQGGYVQDKPVGVGDICATVYEIMGIDPQTPIHDYSNRPVPVAHGGQAIRDILA